MILLNFSHPLTPTHIEQIEVLTKQKVERVVKVPTQFDHERSFAEQVQTLVDGVEFTAEEWQTTPMLVNPPSLNLIAATLLAELHGRMGYFPSVLRLKPVQGSTPPQFEMAEIINLQAVRDRAREQR
jgi:hypothetical protein